MALEDKLIKQGILLTDAWFKQFKARVERDLSLCDTYEEFLERTKDYTTTNILINSGYAAQMEDLIVLILNESKFMRASRRRLVEETIKHNVGILIQNVGEDIKNVVRDTVEQGYDEGLHSREIGKLISKEIDTINNTRARTIARTEVKRTQHIAEYIHHKEQGAKGFNVVCRPDCCPLCAKDYANTVPNPEGERLIGGNVTFTMDQTDMLPPRHPNCRCNANYIY